MKTQATSTLDLVFTSAFRGRPIRRSLAAIFIAASLLAIPANADENSDGVAAARSGNFEQAQMHWERAAAENDPAAMRNLAGLYMSGVLGAPDLERARGLFEKGAELGDAGSQLSLGYIYLNGMGVTTDSARARMYFEAAAKAGDVEARFMRSQMAFEDGAQGEDLQRALNDLRAAADANHPPALARVADLLRTGTYTEQNIQDAIRYHEQAAKFGYVQSANTLGEIYLFAETGEVQMAEAMQWFEKAASEGNVAAAYSLATVIYANPVASDEELARAFHHAEKAAHAWDESAQLLLGRMFLEGRAVPQHLMQAYLWFDLAASAGVHEAHHYRAIAATRLGPEKSAEAHDLARSWFEENHAKPHTHRSVERGQHTFE
ncbi:tetratricopeptide repeat protein [Maritimibacter harenae]|nr:tetratricopeptide repeat protein [Maritimibacter harenae]